MTVNSSSDCDLISSFLDLGPLGSRLPVQLKIPYGLKPGSILFVTAKCENRMCINIKDDANNIVQSLQIKVNKNEITIQDQCSTDSVPTEQTEIFKARFSLTCVCEPEGYRIFINGQQVEFFKRTYANNTSLLDIIDCQVYKIMYTTIIFDNKNNNDATEVPTDTASNNNDTNNNGANEKKEEGGNQSTEDNKNKKDDEEESEEDPVALPPPE